MSVGDPLKLAAIDGQSPAARRAVCRALTDGFDTAGAQLRTIGNIFGTGRINGTSPFGNGDDSQVAVGYLCQTAAALIGGAVDLLDRENSYAAGALIRQLVEVEYLMWAFAEDHEEAATWLRSNREDRLKRWQPRHLRERSGGRFRGADYIEHCELGGHPTPTGVRAYLRSGNRTLIECLFFEVAFHGTSAWRYLQKAVQDYCDAQALASPLSVAPAVDAAIAHWHEHDGIGIVWEAIKEGR